MYIKASKIQSFARTFRISSAFLGTAPQETPALYSLMAYSGFVQGTYYPNGGFVQVIKGMERLCLDLGVTIKKNQCVKKINVKEFKAVSVETQNKHYSSDIVVAAADYEHVDNNLIEKKYRNYNKEYWDKRVMSPSCLLFYLGVDKKINKLTHHNLFFDSDIDQHIHEIYSKKYGQQSLYFMFRVHQKKLIKKLLLMAWKIYFF